MRKAMGRREEEERDHRLHWSRRCRAVFILNHGMRRKLNESWSICFAAVALSKRPYHGLATGRREGLIFAFFLYSCVPYFEP